MPRLLDEKKFMVVKLMVSTQVKGMDNMKIIITHFLNYCETEPKGMVYFRQSYMIFHV